MYRDDGEAARARADALQQDLDETREKLDAAEEDAAAKEHKLAEAEAKLASAEARLAVLGAAKKRKPAPEPPPVAPSDPDLDLDPDPQPRQESLGSPGAVWLVVGCIAVLPVMFALLATRKNSESSQECTLRTEPPGAEIVSICKPSGPDPMKGIEAIMQDAGLGFSAPSHIEMRVGKSPVSMSRTGWISRDVTCQGGMVARLAGYRETPVAAPTIGKGCTDDVVRLERE